MRLDPLQEATARFVHNKRPWNVWATYTFRGEPSDASGHRVLKQHLREVARTFKGHVWYAYAFGPQRRGILHFHILLELPVAPNELALKLLRAMWNHVGGDAKVEHFDPSRGAAYYHALHLGDDINVACPRTEPRCRRSYCAEAPGPQ